MTLCLPMSGAAQYISYLFVVVNFNCNKRSPSLVSNGGHFGNFFWGGGAKV